MSLPRSLALALLITTVLAGCGFKLRSSQDLPFATIAVTPEKGKGVAVDLMRYLGPIVRPVAPDAQGQLPDVILDILEEVPEKVAVGVKACGQVVEYDLRLKLRFKLRTAKGVELIPVSTLEQHRSLSFNSTAVLSKDAEEAMLYRDMQSECVQQLMRRLAAVKLAASVSAP